MTETLTATLTTSQGTITIRLFPDHAPKTVRNFVELAEGGREWTDPRTGQVTKDKLYDGTIFHRVISQFMIQGGDPLGTGHRRSRVRSSTTRSTPTSPSTGRTCWRWPTRARIGRGTNGSQFFVTVVPTYWLNGKHTIFGEVIARQGRRGRDRQLPDQAWRPPRHRRGAPVGHHRRAAS